MQVGGFIPPQSCSAGASFDCIVGVRAAQLAFDRHWPDTAVLIVLGSHTFARSGELVAARVGDFVLQKVRALGHSLSQNRDSVLGPLKAFC